MAIVGTFGQPHHKGVIGDADLLDICYRLAHPQGTRAPREWEDVAQVLEALPDCLDMATSLDR